MKKDKILQQQTTHYFKYEKVKNNPRYRKSWDYILNNTKVGEKILDIGCADGEFLNLLVKKGYKCYGLEMVDKAIEQSKKKGIKVTNDSFLGRLPFNKNTFDIVFAGEVIEHTFDDDLFLSEINRILKPKGILIITTPNLVSLGNRFLMLFGKLPRFAYAQFHYRMFTPELIKKKLQKNNFKVVKFDSSYILISTYYNRFLGFLGEKLGSFFPKFGEHMIVFSYKK
jgi:2-polyprenyl-3-methyl-5-hydroxy-6-metoxy-1,4-benzoquinol methylase